MAVTAGPLSATDRAYQSILEGILTGVYSPGTLLGETALGSDLGMSRTPIRTALTRLQNEGWIRIYPKRGALVQGLSDSAIEDLMESRLILESSSVFRADEGVLLQLATRLEAEVELHREHLARRDVASFIESSLKFHRSFVQASANSVLLEFTDRMMDRQRFLLYHYGDHYLSRADSVIAEHQSMIDSIRRGDGPGFSTTLRVHLTSAYGIALKDVCPKDRFNT